MTPEEFKIKLFQLHDQIGEFIHNKAPKIVGKTAVDHFKDNFRKGGFDNKKWSPSQRQDGNGYTSEKYGPLLSARNELMNSLTYELGNGKVIISSDKVYAEIHNNGGVINIPITDKMRKFAWAKHYKETENKKGQGGKWKALALTKKDKITVNMPQRQFVGVSDILNKRIVSRLENNLSKILNNGNNL
jgi:phage gpG-like protein